jgi:FkbM family methyltransferase
MQYEPHLRRLSRAWRFAVYAGSHRWQSWHDGPPASLRATTQSADDMNKGARPSRSVVSRALRAVQNRVRRLAVGALTAPRRLQVPGSALSFHVHSAIENRRVSDVQETWTIAWMRAVPPGSVVYDVGANIGIDSLIAAERDDRSVRVVAIEPFPANFASLVKNMVHNGLQDRVIPVPFGLGRSTGLVRYNWANAQPGGALHSFGEIVRPRTGEVVTPVAHHHCVCYRLDDLVKLPNLPFPTHIKIDVDGGELDVLAGAPEVLRDTRCRAIQVEVIDTDAACTRSRDVIGLLEAAGFSLMAEYRHKLPRVRDLQFARK